MRTSYLKTEKGFPILIDQIRIGPCFTLETGEAAVQRLCEVIEPEAENLLTLFHAAEAKRQWNYDNYPNGRNWPEFSRFEKTFKALQKRAQIVDS